MNMVGTATPAVRPACEANTGVRSGTHGFESVTCNTRIGLRSFLDAFGTRRFYCGAPGHLASVRMRFGEAIHEGMD